MAFSFYKSPYLPTILKNYHPGDYYAKWIDMLTWQVSPNIFMKQMSDPGSFAQKSLRAIRTLAARHQLFQLRRIKNRMKNDPALQAFHEGHNKALPQLYRNLYRQKLGRYADLMTDQDMIPRL